MKKQSGFTLIELMVVMAIIAILATAGLTAYSNYLKKARDSSRLQTARQLMTKVEELANGGPIPSVQELKDFLIAENFASTTTSINSGLELFNIDSIDGQGVCISGLCGFMYITLTGNNYLIGYGVEHVDSQQNVLQLWNPSSNSPLYQDGPDGIEDILVGGNFSYVSWFANFIGTSSEAFSEGYVESSSTPRVIEAQFISNYNLYQHS